MKKFDLVKLNKSYEKQNLIKDMHGIVIELKGDNVDVLFFNEKIVPDYVIVNVKLEDLLLEEEKLPEQFEIELKTNLENLIANAKHILEKPIIKEYDIVELLVEDEKYSKFGVHKGDSGCVMDDRIIQNQILVDFSKIDKDGKFSGDCISVDINHIGIVE